MTSNSVKLEEPHSASDSEEKHNNSPVILPMMIILKEKKRARNEHLWKYNLMKAKRQKGEAYLSKNNEIIEERKLKPPCLSSCRNKCSFLLTEDQRNSIHNHFWKKTLSWESKRQFVLNCTSKQEIKRRRARKDSTKMRAAHYKFFFNIDEVSIKVCKLFFLNTLSISEGFLSCTLRKCTPTGEVEPDKRGKKVPINKTPDSVIQIIKDHINSYPTSESYSKKYLAAELNVTKMYGFYCAECETKNIEPAKLWLFRRVFNEDFDLSFHLPDDSLNDPLAPTERGKEADMTQQNNKKLKTDVGPARMFVNTRFDNLSFEKSMDLAR